VTRRNRCLVQDGAVTREIPAPAGGVVIETVVPWKMVRRGLRKRIVTPLGEPEAFAEEATQEAAAQDTPLLRAPGLAHHWQRLLDGGGYQACGRSPRPRAWTSVAPVASCG
jgi:hypothetical protein